MSLTDNPTELDDLAVWLKSIGLDKHDKALREARIETLTIINELDEDDINEIINDINMHKLHANVLKRAIKKLKNGEYKPIAENTTEEKVIEAKYDEQLIQLIQKRKNWRDYVTVKYKKGVSYATEGETRNIIFIGQTGAGKTTLINSMCNYLYKVEYTEKFRYKLICEENDEKVNTKDETQSQTQEIKSYHLDQLEAIDYSLNIIDTPGFADTSGVEKDKEITDGFKNFFEDQLSMIDAIYFVVKASDTRLGAKERYVFKMILDLFGEDVKDNTFILFTFCDMQEPKGLKSIKKLKIPFARWFKLNNSGFNLTKNDNNASNVFHKCFYDFGVGQFAEMFDGLAQLQTKSTEKTKETLKERDSIIKLLEVVHKDVQLKLDQTTGIEKTRRALEDNKDIFMSGSNIPIRKTLKTRDKKQHKWWVQYCESCDQTCCCKCYALSQGWCGIYNFWGQCKIGLCKDKKCKKSHHKYVDFVIKYETKSECVTKDEMIKEYNLQLDETATLDDILKELEFKVEEKEKSIQKSIQEMNKSANRLHEIALNKEILDAEQYFDELIHHEQESRNDLETKTERIEFLQKLKRQDKELKKLMENGDVSFDNDNDNDNKISEIETYNSFTEINIAFLGFHNKYLSAYKNGNIEVNVDNIEENEIFKSIPIIKDIESPNDCETKVCFKLNGINLYLSCEKNGKLALKPTVTDCEQWIVEQEEKSGMFSFKSCHNTYLCAEKKTAVANRKQKKNWEKFRIIVQSESHVSDTIIHSKENLKSFSISKLKKIIQDYVKENKDKMTDNDIKDVELIIYSHNGHYKNNENYTPENILKDDNYYYYSSNGVIVNDWIVLRLLKSDVYYFPIKIKIRAWNGNASVKKFQLCIGNFDSNKWISCHKELFMSDRTKGKEWQEFEFDIIQNLNSSNGLNEMLDKIYKNKFTDFKLSLCNNYGNAYYVGLYQFKLYGIELGQKKQNE